MRLWHYKLIPVLPKEEWKPIDGFWKHIIASENDE
jgi:hypothetical protein